MNKDLNQCIKNVLFLCYIEEAITEIECFNIIKSLETDLSDENINEIMNDCNTTTITEKKIGLIFEHYCYELFTSEEDKKRDLKEIMDLQKQYVTGS
jgi:hypothetical protein